MQFSDVDVEVKLFTNCAPNPNQLLITLENMNSWKKQRTWVHV